MRGLLASHQWRGNIRELRNVVEYFSYTGNQLILPGDLPPTFRYLPRQELPGAAVPAIPASAALPAPAVGPGPAAVDAAARRFVLHQLYAADCRCAALGREAILQAARAERFPLSQQEVRRILAALAAEGLARVSRGRGGTRLTPQGRSACQRGAL